MRPGRGARLENCVPPLHCVSRVGTVHRHQCLHPTQWGALGHTASEPHATFLLAGPGGSLSLRWSDSGVNGAEGALPPTVGGLTPSLPALVTPGCGGLGSGGSLLWGQGHLQTGVLSGPKSPSSRPTERWGWFRG